MDVELIARDCACTVFKRYDSRLGLKLSAHHARRRKDFSDRTPNRKEISTARRDNNIIRSIRPRWFDFLHHRRV